jgi:hypothetical protein
MPPRREGLHLMSRHQHLRAIVNEDGAAVLNADSGRIATLNATGAVVWQALEHGECPEAIAEDLARRTGEPVEVIREDVAGFIEALKKQGLLPC